MNPNEFMTKTQMSAVRAGFGFGIFTSECVEHARDRTVLFSLKPINTLRTIRHDSYD